MKMTIKRLTRIHKDTIEKWGLNRIADGCIIFGSKTKAHRLDGPSNIHYYDSGQIRYECYFRNNKLFRPNGPAIIEYYKNGKIESEEYHGSVANSDGPDRIEYFVNGRRKIETYIRDGLPHRESGPACIFYFNTGKIKGEFYIQNGVFHRSDGPSRIIYTNNGKIKTEEYHIQGVELPKFVVMSPEKITLETIDIEHNIEAKRIMIERMGWLKYLEQKNPKVIDENVDEISGTNEVLFNCSMGRILVCACPSTGRIYPVEVPRRIKTCKDAQKYLMGRRFSKIRIVGAS